MRMMYKHMILALLVMVCTTGLLTADTYAKKDEFPADNRIKLLHYHPNDIYTIYTLYGYQTNIEFARNERIRTISVGDRSLWQIVPSGHRLFIRPMDDNVTTNMTVITDRYTYQFDLKSGKGGVKANPRMVYVARFVYPEKKRPAPPVATVPVPMPATTAPIAIAPSASSAVKPMVALPPAEPVKTVELKNYTPPPTSPSMPVMHKAAENNDNYTYTGPDPLAPIELYDDGASTYMRLPNMSGPLPKLFTLTGAKPTSIPYRVVGGVLVISDVHATMLLDYGGKDKVQLYNEKLLPEGM